MGQNQLAKDIADTQCYLRNISTPVRTLNYGTTLDVVHGRGGDEADYHIAFGIIPNGKFALVAIAAWVFFAGLDRIMHVSIRQVEISPNKHIPRFRLAMK